MKVNPSSLHPKHYSAEACIPAELQAKSKLMVPRSPSTSKSDYEKFPLKEASSNSLFLVARQPLRPRFESADLLRNLKTIHFERKSQSLDYYAEKLLQLTQQWKSVFLESRPVLTAIQKYHVLVRLKWLSVTDPADQAAIEEYKTLVAGDLIEEQYCVLQEALRVIGGLAARFRIVRPHQFSYRLASRAMNLKVLDLQAMNEDLYTVETLWFALMSSEHPVEAQLSLAAKSFAEVLLTATEDVFQQAVALNWEGNLQLTMRTANLSDPEKSDEPLSAKKLEVRSVLIRCFKPDQREEEVLKLKRLLVSFHAAYHQFEKELLCSFV